jgi:hypothetical protein
MISKITKLTKTMSAGNCSPEDAKSIQGEYSAIYEEAKKRADRAYELIKLGRLTEAKMVIDQDVNLIKVIETLHFGGLKKWIENCKANNVQLNEFLANDVIDKLKEVYFNSSSVEHLISKYRKLVLVGTDLEKINLLREIISSNPNDRSWVDSIIPLEEKYISQLAEQYASSDGESFKDAVHYYNEIVATKWAYKVPAELRSKVKENYVRLLHDRVQREANDLIESMPVNDLKKVSETMKHYEKLQSTVPFELSENLQQKISVAKKRLIKENNEKISQEKFNKQLDNVQALLSTELKNGYELKLAYDKLKAFERSIELSIQNNVEFKLDSFERKISRKLNYSRGILLVASIAISLGIYFSYKSYTKMKIIESISNEVSHLLGEGKPGEALEHYNNWLVKKEEYKDNWDILLLRKKIDTYISEFAKNKIRIQEVKSELTSIKNKNFDIDEEVINFNLKQAHELFISAEDKRHLKKWELAWRLKNNEVKLLNNKRYMKTLKEANDVLALKNDALRVSERVIMFKDMTAKVTEVMLLKNNVSELVASQMTGVYKELKEKVENLDKVKITREDNAKRFKATLDKLKNNKINIKQYRTDIIFIFAKDAEFDLFVKLKSDLESVNHAASVTSFDSDDFDSVFNENSKYDQEKFLRNPYKLLVNNLYKAKVAQTKVKNQLETYFTNKLFSELYEVKFTEKREGLEDVDKKLILLSNKDLIKSPKKFSINGSSTKYWKIKHCSNKSGELQLAEYMGYADEAEIKLMSHVPYTNKSSEVILYSKTEDFFNNLYEVINDMVQDNEVNPFVKALYMETFLKEMGNVGISTDQTKKIMGALNRLFYNSVIWVASEDPKTKLKEKELSAALTKHLERDFSDLGETFKNHSRELKSLLKSLKDRLQYAGVVTKEGEKWVFNTITDSEKLISPQWNVKNNKVKTVVIALKNEQGFFEPTEKGKELIYEGMPFMIINEQ